MKQKTQQQYAERVAALTTDIQRLRRDNTLYVVGQLTTFGLAIAAVVAYTVWSGSWLIAAALLVAAYILIRHRDVENSRRIDEQEALRTVYEHEQQYQQGDLSPFDDGARYADAAHPYALDLDIFGPLSLYQHVCRTVTTGGSDRLVHYLLTAGDNSREDILRRADAIRELAGREALRTRFISHGHHGRIRTDEVLDALHAIRSARLSRFPSSTAAMVVAVLSVGTLWVLVALALAGVVSTSVPFWWAMVQFAVVFVTQARPLRQTYKAAHAMHKPMKTCISLITLVAGADLQSDELRATVRQLTADGRNAATSFRELKRIIDDIDRRTNELWAFLSNALYAGDFFLVRRFLRWQARYELSVADWMDALSHFDALTSMATFRYNEPQATDAVLTDDTAAVVYEASGLYHPFLTHPVKNDFTIRDHHFYIVTGANMAGKSTFLRSLGINYVLAMNGMAVFADALRLSVFALFTSMRTTDDLSHGISYFNAELLRLQQLLNSCAQRQATLTILDEILKGTNSLDKLNGSRLFLQHVAELRVTGIIATHDLELSRLEQEHPDRFHNYCFEIKLSDDITYTYQITPGVARNQNATHLLRKIIGRPC